MLNTIIRYTVCHTAEAITRIEMPMVCMQSVAGKSSKIIAAIMHSQQMNLASIIQRNEKRHPYVESWAREVIPECTVYTKSCALYLGTDRMKLSNNTTLDYQKEV